MTTPVIARKHLPVKPPLTLSMILWLFLDRYEAAGWVHGIVWTLIALWWVGFFIALYKEDDREPEWRQK